MVDDHVGAFMQINLKQVSALLLVMITLSACIGIKATVLPSDDLNQKTIDSCTVIDEPGRYELTADIKNGGGTRISQTCIEIKSGDVIIDGNGHTIDGRGNSHTTAIQVNTPKGSDDILIANVELAEWHKGIVFENGSQGKIRDVTTSSNVYGISVEDSSLVATRDNELNRNLVGMKISDNSMHFQLWGNTFSNNQVEKI